MMREHWRPVVGHPNYEVSDQGRVRNAKTGRVHKPKPYGKGVRRSYVATLGNKWTREAVHRMVLRAFVGEPPPGTEGSHLNGDPLDNRLENLAWEDHSTNLLRKREHGTMICGEAVNTAKLTEAQVRELRALWAQGVKGPELARRFGLANSSTYQIIHRKSWSHVA